MAQSVHYSIGLPTERGVTIHRKEDGISEPVLSVELLAEGRALPVEKLAHNVVDVLNGEPSAHMIDLCTGEKVFYSRSGMGIILSARMPGELSGVSQDNPLAAILAHGRGGPTVRALEALDNLGMKAVCDMVVRPEDGAAPDPRPPAAPKPQHG